MSMHKIELSECEAVGLKTYKLPIGEPSQLSDSFRLGVLWANLWSAGSDGWISVDERDPEMYQRVMVATVDCDDNPIVTIRTFNHGKRYLAVGGARDKDVTHWMPLPEAPTK